MMTTATTTTTTRRTGSSSNGSCGGNTNNNGSGGHVFHYAKFRWTENLTCRFIQLRRQHGKMFTGRKYSAQAGWEYILRQMREEFPTVMADVHYRVLKKKWSNLLQQYKELKNPVQGDKNKADDISWPFYAAIDQVVGGGGNSSSLATQQQQRRCRRRLTSSSRELSSAAAAIDADNDDEDDDLNPQEFLCVSVAPDDDDEGDAYDAPLVDYSRGNNDYSDVVVARDGEIIKNEVEEEEDECRDDVRLLQQQRSCCFEHRSGQGAVFDVERITGRGGRATRHRTLASTTTTNDSRKRSASIEGRCPEPLMPRLKLPASSELTIRPLPGTRPSLASTAAEYLEQQPSGSGAINGRVSFGRDSGVKKKNDTGEAGEDNDEEVRTSLAARPRKCARWSTSQDYRGCYGGEESAGERDDDVRRVAMERDESRLEKRIGELLDYQRQRDAENRCILMRMLEAIEDIRNAVR